MAFVVQITEIVATMAEFGETYQEDGNQKSNGILTADDASKIFVGGLSWETSSEHLKQYFEQFGTVTDCTIKTDPHTGKPRGFGFVVFSDPSCVDSVLAHGTHELHGKKIDPKRAQRLGPEPVKKIFIGGLDPFTPESEIQQYFGQFGTIEELILPTDKTTNTRKPFAFITFDSEGPVEQLCANPMHTVGGKSVEVKKATQKPAQGAFGGRGGARGAFGGRGGAPRGGRGTGRGNRFGGAGAGGPGGYRQTGGWDMTGGGYDNGWADYSAYGGQYGVGSYDPYGQQQYGAGGYDYNAWYGGAAQAGPVNGPSFGGRGQRGGANNADSRYQPYSR